MISDVLGYVFVSKLEQVQTCLPGVFSLVLHRVTPPYWPTADTLTVCFSSGSLFTQILNITVDFKIDITTMAESCWGKGHQMAVVISTIHLKNIYYTNVNMLYSL